MPTRTTSIANFATTDVAFRAFCQMMHDNFAASGMVQTGDTGQINLSTVTKPAGASATAGYEIWRFNDSLQSTAPIFLKIEYITSAHASDPSVAFSVGTGSDGAGNLTYAGWPAATGVLTRRVLTLAQPVAGSHTGNVYFTYLADGSWAVMAWPGAAPAGDAGGSGFYSIERFRNADGTPNGDGVTVIAVYCGGGGSAAMQESKTYLPIATQMSGGTTTWQIPYTQVGTASAALGTTMYPVPVFTGNPPRMAAPSQLVLACGKDDVSVGTVLTMSHYGASRSWVAAGVGYSNTGWSNFTPTAQFRSFIFRTD